MLNELFDNYKKFVSFFKANDSKELRDRLLKTDKLRYWYCKGVEDQKEVWEEMTSERWIFAYCISVKNRHRLRKRVNLDVCNWKNRSPYAANQFDVP